MTSLCIIGAGITGLSLLLLLQEAGTDLSKVTIIDPHFDGGDLARRWGPVISNTPWSKTVNALKECCPSLLVKDDRDPTRTTPLVDVAHMILGLARKSLSILNQIQGEVLETAYTDANGWVITYKSEGFKQTLSTKAVVFCQGSEPKTLNLPIPSVPLECALDRTRLSGYVKAGQRVLLFGTMHSGCLILRNLHEVGANTTAFYKSATPFIWDRDGAYDGIKEEAAQIADAIVAGTYGQTKLVPASDITRAIRSALNADWAIYAIGFSRRSSIGLRVNGVKMEIDNYNGLSGKFDQLSNAWGFGIAYPNQAPDGKHWDVSVAAFLVHMKQQLPEILAIF